MTDRHAKEGDRTLNTTEPPRRRHHRPDKRNPLGPQGLATRRALLDALHEELAERSWGRVTILEVTFRAEVSTPTWHQYFHDLAEGFAALCELADSGEVELCGHAVLVRRFLEDEEALGLGG